MPAADLIHDARVAARLGQVDLAHRAGTSQPTLSTYEKGRVSPRLDVVERIIQAAGFELSITPRIEFTMHVTDRGRPFFVPNRLPQQPPHCALAKIQFPISVYWSEPGRTFDLSEHADRMYAYQILIQEGRPENFLSVMDGTLLLDMWEELFLPRDIRPTWEPIVARTRNGNG